MCGSSHEMAEIWENLRYKLCYFQCLHCVRIKIKLYSLNKALIVSQPNVDRSRALGTRDLSTFL